LLDHGRHDVCDFIRVQPGDLHGLDILLHLCVRDCA
jgi:hypothetical protein